MFYKTFILTEIKTYVLPLKGAKRGVSFSFNGSAVSCRVGEKEKLVGPGLGCFLHRKKGVCPWGQV